MSLDFNRLEQVLSEAAIKADPTQRAAFLNEACGQDRELRAEVERLLAANEQAGDFLETPVQPAPEQLTGDGNDKTETLAGCDITIERAGAMIGRYKLLEEIGEGGFGVVYLAEQTEPVQRKVALKVVKAGMDTREVVGRFEAERQALALMDHPNIAQVFDGGVTQAGRPYFVMELVRGIPITDFCDQRNLSAVERLQLFSQVCHAVQHAHQKGIIHRDLKPTNILVTLIDSEPVPKVIDFGVAKALGQKLTEKTLFTGFLHLVGTPAYMSPEQAEMSGVDVDTRADIYSLGVLLYELLTGVTPFDAETFRQAALDEIRHTICQTEPPKPSTRLRTLGERLVAVAKHRHTEPAALSRLLRGDLDWIVMKCLEKDRRRRYETANGLAADIERHLDHDPVLACPPGAGYRMRKFLRRNRVPVAFAASVAAALVLGLVTALIGFSKARSERDRAVTAEETTKQERDRALAAEAQAERNQQSAETEAARSAQVAGFMRDMLKGVGPGVARGRDTALLREILDQTAERIGRDLTNQPAVELELCNTIGDAYWELSAYAQAESNYRRALDLTRTLYEGDDLVLANALHAFAEFLRRYGTFSEAEKIEREALSIYRKLYGDEHPTVGDSLNSLFFLLAGLGRNAEAEAMGRQALALNEKLLGIEHPIVGRSLSRLAVVLELSGKSEEAEAMHRQGVAVHKKVLAHEFSDREKSVELPWSLHHLSSLLQKRGKLVEAETVCREALSARKTLEGPDHQDVEITTRLLVSVLLEQGKLAEADAVTRELLVSQKKISGNEHLETGQGLGALGQAFMEAAKRGGVADPSALEVAEWSSRGATYLTARQWTNGIQAYSKAIELKPDQHWFYHERGYCYWQTGQFEQMLADYTRAVELDPRHSGSWARRGIACLNLGRPEDAAADFRTAVEGGDADGLNSVAWWLATHGDSRVRDGQAAVRAAEKAVAKAGRTNAMYLDTLAAAYAEAGQFTNAVDVQNEAIALLKTSAERENYAARLKLYLNGIPYRDHGSLASRARTLLEDGKFAEAESAFREALAIRRNAFGNDHRDVALALDWLGTVLERQGRLAEAEAADREALTMWRRLLPADKVNLFALTHKLGCLLRRERKFDEARTNLLEALALSEGSPGQDTPHLNGALGEVHAELGELKLARASYARVCEQSPTNGAGLYECALLSLSTGDTNGYRDMVERIVNHLQTSTPGPGQHLLPWACALGRDALTNYSPVIEALQRALAAQTNNENVVAYGQALGALRYRASEYSEATRQLTENYDLAGRLNSEQIPTSSAYGFYFLAMTHARLGETNEAIRWFQRASESDFVTTPTETNALAASRWNRRLTLQLLRQEAESVLKTTSPEPLSFR